MGFGVDSSHSVWSCDRLSRCSRHVVQPRNPVDYNITRTKKSTACALAHKNFRGKLRRDQTFMDDNGSCIFEE